MTNCASEGLVMGCHQEGASVAGVTSDEPGQDLEPAYIQPHRRFIEHPDVRCRNDQRRQRKKPPVPETQIVRMRVRLVPKSDVVECFHRGLSALLRWLAGCTRTVGHLPQHRALE